MSISVFDYSDNYMVVKGTGRKGRHAVPPPTSAPGYLELIQCPIYGSQQLSVAKWLWEEVWGTSPVKLLGPAHLSFLHCECHILIWVVVAARWQKIPQPEHHFPF